MINIKKAVNIEIDPISTALIVLNTYPGNLDAIPANIIIEAPLPIPYNEICSPSHITNIEPADIVKINEIINPNPGLRTIPALCNPSAYDVLYKTASPNVR